MEPLTGTWYRELCSLWPGQCMSIEVEENLYCEQSEFQKIEVLQTKTYGRMLCLDGIIQLTERDEFAYQEMLALVPLLSHPNPKTVCVIGGGDGAIITRLAMHKGLENIYICELDIGVINTSKKYFPQFAAAFDDPRVTIITTDGAKFLDEKSDFFDVIITDSSDPIGPADTLFSSSYFSIIHKALKSDGISGSQGECMWLHLDLIERIVGDCKKNFQHVDYGMISIPTYPSGQIGVLVCSKKDSPRTPKVALEEVFSAKNLKTIRYYTPEIHTGCFAVPKFVADKLY